MERCPTQAVLPLFGLAAEKVIRDAYINESSNRLAVCDARAALRGRRWANNTRCRRMFRGRDGPNSRIPQRRME
ncbi:MAG: hypothetical protein R6U98_24195 [Pirellulaceae bacterium]